MRSAALLTITMAIIVLSPSTLASQTIVSQHLLLADPTTGHMIKLQVPALSGPLTLNLPTSNGTLITTANGWALGGNDLSLAGPTENQLGSTSASMTDVDLIAGGDVKLRIGATGTVLVPDGTKLALQDDDETNTSSFVAGNQTNDIAYTLPTTTPTVNQVLTATAVTGNDVTLGWADGGGGKTTATLGTNFGFADTETLTDVPGLSVSLAANTTYEVTAVVELSQTAGGANGRVVFAKPSGAYVYMRRLDDPDNVGANITTGTNNNYASNDSYVFHGFIRTFATAGDFKIQVRLVSDNGGVDSWDVVAGSFISVKPF